MIDLALTFAALRDWRNRRAAEVDADALPAELAASIAAARITVRPPRDLAEAIGGPGRPRAAPSGRRHGERGR